MGCNSDDPRNWVPATHVGDPDQAPASHHLWPGSVLTLVGVIQEKGGALMLSLCLCVSIKQAIKESGKGFHKDVERLTPRAPLVGDVKPCSCLL